MAADDVSLWAFLQGIAIQSPSELRIDPPSSKDRETLSFLTFFRNSAYDRHSKSMPNTNGETP